MYGLLRRKAIIGAPEGQSCTVREVTCGHTGQVHEDTDIKLVLYSYVWDPYFWTDLSIILSLVLKLMTKGRVYITEHYFHYSVLAVTKYSKIQLS